MNMFQPEVLLASMLLLVFKGRYVEELTVVQLGKGGGCSDMY